jgi:general secretion pathway protein F
MRTTFSYTARAVDGAFIAGTLRADNRTDALAHLRRRLACITSLETSKSTRGKLWALLWSVPVRAKARVVLFRSFATLIGAGVPISRALGVVIEGARESRLREALRSVAAEVENGDSLSNAMERRPREFSPLFVAMVQAGEVGGCLHDALERLAQLLERERALTQRLRSALVYPAIVSASAAALVLFLIANVVPSFAAMFEEMHAPLPPATKLLIALGNVLSHPGGWIVISAVPIVGIALFVTAREQPALRERIDATILTIPVSGPLVRKGIQARFSGTLGTLLSSGVALMPALEAASGVIQNAHFRTRVKCVSESLREGEGLANSLARGCIFDPVSLQLIRAGEESGTLGVCRT